MSDEQQAGQRGPNYNWEIESRHWEQECYNLRDMMVKVDGQNERLYWQLEQVAKALKFARMTLEHALALDYLGEGSTKVWQKTPFKRPIKHSKVKNKTL